MFASRQASRLLNESNAKLTGSHARVVPSSDPSDCICSQMHEKHQKSSDIIVSKENSEGSGKKKQLRFSGRSDSLVSGMSCESS